jgi:hypothetical protein
MEMGAQQSEMKGNESKTGGILANKTPKLTLYATQE